jgi:single-strand DNA-binding protein
MNKVYLIGNLTRDPESRATQNGIPVCNFSITVNRRFKNPQTGQYDVDYFNVVAWRQLADLCSQYLAKGRKVAVLGSIQTRTYQAQDGSNRFAVDIVADEVEFLSSAQNNEAQQAAAALPHTSVPGARQAAPVAQPATMPNYDAAPAAPVDAGMTQVDDDELPF